VTRKSGWTRGNELRLLENGEEYFPRVFEAIRNARREVLVETFIWFEDSVGYALRDALVEAAKRGATVDVTVDGYGTPTLSDEFLAPMLANDVRVFTFDPKPTWFGVRVNPFCRLHRKIVVVDGTIAFVGGINFSEDQECARGPDAKQDYAVEATGPIVQEIQRFCYRARVERAVPRRRRYWLRRFPRGLSHPRADMQALFATRDNAEHPTDIETLYRLAFRRAKSRILLANAYFFPGYRFLRDLRRAAERGVDVRLMLQGRPDKDYPQAATESLYESLLSSGIRVFNYEAHALHAKVAVVDDTWATVGSSNLDPTSFALNLEANIVIRDRKFADELRSRLERLMDEECSELERDRLAPVSFWKRLVRIFFYHFGRHFPRWGRRFPLTRQQLRRISSGAGGP
jgi:cardiolipin synthase